MLDALLLGKYQELYQDKDSCRAIELLTGKLPCWGTGLENESTVCSAFLAGALHGKEESQIDPIIDQFEDAFINGARTDLLDMLPIKDGEKQFAKLSVLESV